MALIEFNYFESLQFLLFRDRLPNNCPAEQIGPWREKKTTVCVVSAKMGLNHALDIRTTFNKTLNSKVKK